MKSAYLVCNDLSPLPLRRGGEKALSPLQAFLTTRRLCEAQTLAVLLLRPQKALIQYY